METTYSPAGGEDRIVSWLLDHAQRGIVEKANDTSTMSYDVRQEAAMRTYVALARRGLKTDDFRKDLDVNANLAKGAIAHVRNEQGRRRARRRSLADVKRLVRNDEICYLLDDETAEIQELLLDEHGFECDDATEELDALSAKDKAHREAVCLMRWIAHRKEQELPYSTNAVRSKLKRLRKQTGLRLDPSLL